MYSPSANAVDNVISKTLPLSDKSVIALLTLLSILMFDSKAVAAFIGSEKVTLTKELPTVVIDSITGKLVSLAVTSYTVVARSSNPVRINLTVAPAVTELVL